MSSRHTSIFLLTVVDVDIVISHYTLLARDSHRLHLDTAAPKAALRKHLKPPKSSNPTTQDTMSPTYTMSAHLCKQIYSSWRQTHPNGNANTNAGAGASATPLPSPPAMPTAPISYFRRSPSPDNNKRSMDNDRSDPASASSSLSSSPPTSSWRWGSR